MPARTVLRPAKWLVTAAAGLACAAAVAGIGAVYVMGRGNGNAGGCDSALKTAARLDASRIGDMAGFRPASEPVDLSALSFAGPDGKPLALASLKGRTLLVNLWATWCVPCRKEMPSLDALQGTLGGNSFSVVPVNLDLGDDSKPAAFYKQAGITRLPHYADHTMGIFNAVKAEGLALGLPATLLADPKGCLIGSLSGPADWNGAAARSLIGKALEPGS